MTTSSTEPIRPTSIRILAGGAGGLNYGDELIVKGWLDFFAQIGDEKERLAFQEDSWHPSQVLHNLDERYGSRVLFQRHLTEISRLMPENSFWQEVERGFTFMRDFGFKNHGYKNTRDYFEANSYHLHGGGYLNDELFNGARLMKGFLVGFGASLHKLYGIPTYATGIGFGPFDAACPDPARFAEILSHYDVFEVRDAQSYRELTTIAPDANIINGLDDTFILPATRIFKVDSSVRRLHLSIISAYCPPEGDPFWAWLAHEATAFDEVVVWSSSGWEDRTPTKLLKAAIPDCKILTTQHLVYSLPPIGKDDVFLAQRFHVHFAAARAGARGFYLSHTEYYRQKHQSIIDLGSGLQPLDLTDLPSLGNIPPISPLDEAGLRNRKLGLLKSFNYNVPAGFLTA